MPVVMVFAIVVVLTGIVAVALGRGGELSHEEADHAPLDMGPMSATDVVLLRPPTVLWGYSTQVTDEALERIAGAIRDRDVRIVALEQRIAELTADDDYMAPSRASHARGDRQLSGSGFYPATEPPVTGTGPAPPSGLSSEPTSASGLASGPGTGAAPEPGQEPEPGREPDTGTGEAAPERAAAGDQTTAAGMTNDEAVNRSDG